MKIYIARPGDSLTELAFRYQLPEEKLLEANPHIEDPAHLSPGVKIRIPTGKISLSLEKQQEDRSIQDGTTKAEELYPTYVFPLDLAFHDWNDQSKIDEKTKRDFWDDESYEYNFEPHQHESSTSSSLEEMNSYPFIPYYPVRPTIAPDSVNPEIWANSIFYPPMLSSIYPPNFYTPYFSGPYPIPPMEPQNAAAFYPEPVSGGKVDSSAEF